MSKEEKIQINEKEVSLKFSKDVIISEWIFPDYPFSCDIYLEDNVKFESVEIMSLHNIKGTIHIHSKSNTKCYLKLGIEFTGTNELSIIQTLNRNKNDSEIKIRAMGLDNGSTTLITNGIITKNTKENTFLEEIKILETKENKINCIPLLNVETNDAEVNHNVTIRSFSIDELFYLQSKGLSTVYAKELIKNGFIKTIS